MVSPPPLFHLSIQQLLMRMRSTQIIAVISPSPSLSLSLLQMVGCKKEHFWKFWKKCREALSENYILNKEFKDKYFKSKYNTFWAV
jgi:hypothetical protein